MPKCINGCGRDAVLTDGSCGRYCRGARESRHDVGVEVLARELQQALARIAALEAMLPRCPECGPCRIDEDGCCTGCGEDASRPVAARLARARAMLSGADK